MKHYVYVHQNKSNSKIYVGYSSELDKRWRSTKNAAFNPNDEQHNEPLYRAIRRDGWDGFIHQTIEEFDNEQDALDAEIFWIEFFRSNRKIYGPEHGYNLHPGGNLPPNQKGVPRSEEYKSMMAIIRPSKYSISNDPILRKGSLSPEIIEQIRILSATMSERQIAQKLNITRGKVRWWLGRNRQRQNQMHANVSLSNS